MMRHAAVLAHEYLSGEATREELVHAVQRWEASAQQTKPGKNGPDRVMNKNNLIKRRLEATVGEHICALWPNCSASCSRPDFQNETLQYRAFADPLQRVLTDGDRSRGVVREVLGRIARKQDAELSNLVATQQKEIAGLKAKAAASLSSLSEEEALHDQCKTAIARGLIDNTTPATQALLRVLKHCHPAAAAFKTVVSLPDPYHHACQHEQSSVAPKKSDPFFLPPGRKVPSYEPTLTLARPCRVRPRNEAVSKETIVPPSCIPTMRPEEWVRQQRLKNASEMSSIILQSMSKVPRPSDRQGLSWFLPQEAPLSKLMDPRPAGGQQKRTAEASPLPPKMHSVSVPCPSDRQGLARFLPQEAPLSRLTVDPRGQQKRTAEASPLPPKMPSVSVPCPSDRQGLARFLPQEAPLSKLIAHPAHMTKDSTELAVSYH
jgi:hypothetical protein